MGIRRQFSREFKLEAVRLVKDRGVSVAQAARDLDVHENVLRKWIREATVDPQEAFPRNGVMKPEQAEIDRLRKELAKLKMEHDILKKPRPTSPRNHCEVRVLCDTPRGLAGEPVVRGAWCLAKWLLRLAGAAPQSSKPSRRSDWRPGAAKLHRQRPHLWRTPCVARCSGPRPSLRTASHRTTDVAAGAACPSSAQELAQRPGHTQRHCQ